MLAAVFREEAARLTVGVVRLVGDFGVAEEIVGDTLVVAVARWRRDGVPENPGAWLALTARRRAIDRLRRERRYREKLAELAAANDNDRSDRAADTSGLDDRLRLIFTCCHPALGEGARVALTLQAVLGFTTHDIGAAFLTSENTVAQRLVRARRKISEAGIPYRVPLPDELEARLASVLTVLYLMFNEGYLSSRPSTAERRDLADDAAWLAALVVELLPDAPEAMGLLALMRLHLARGATRFDERGELVLLREQDRSRWDRASIESAIDLLERAGALHRTGPYQLQAAIAACHAEASSWDNTDMVQVLVLYDRLLEMEPSPVIRLNRAIALREVAGPAAALAEVEAIASSLAGYHLLHATRGELLRDLGRDVEARDAQAAALALTRNPAERRLLERRLFD